MLLAAIRNREKAASPGTELGGVVIRVRGGYHPNVVHARANEPIRVTFVREETASCSERVVFPDFGKSTMLPHGEPVLVELPPSEPGAYEFTCAMNILRGRLVVEHR